MENEKKAQKKTDVSAVDKLAKAEKPKQAEPAIAPKPAQAAQKPGQEPKTNPEKIKYLRDSAKKRKFEQTFDLIINLKNIDLKKPENRFSMEFRLPEGRGKKTKITFIADSYEKQARELADVVLTKADIAKMAKEKRKMKKLATETDFFLAETTLMAEIGKTLGPILAPRGKMPKPVPPKINIEGMVSAIRDSVRLSLKSSPVIQVPIGSEAMKDDAILKNLEAVYNTVVEKLPKSRANIRSVYLKLTTSRPVKLEVK